jgi:hypothetical protein
VEEEYRHTEHVARTHADEVNRQYGCDYYAGAYDAK